MEDFPINVTDAVVIGVLLASGLLAFARGFVSELLSIASWVGAILVTFHLFPVVSFLARDYIELELIADGVTILGVFVIALVLFSTIGHFIARRARAAGMGFLDRTLGFVFGLARGAVMISLAYLALVWLMPRDEHPVWVQEARVLPLVAYGGHLLQRMAPTDTFAQLEAAADQGLESVLPPKTVKEALRLFIERVPVPAAETPPDSDPETGYKNEERKRLDQLIEAQEAN
jgi:membrane protein required for colicin V production